VVSSPPAELWVAGSNPAGVFGGSFLKSNFVTQIAKNASMPATEGAAKLAAKASPPPHTDVRRGTTLPTASPPSSLTGADDSTDDKFGGDDVVKKVAANTSQKSLKTSAIPEISYSRCRKGQFLKTHRVTNFGPHELSLPLRVELWLPCEYFGNLG
jgi:hypothetical protein